MFSGYGEGEEERLLSVAVLWRHCVGDYTYVAQRPSVSGGVWERSGRESVTNPPCDVHPAHGIFVKSLVDPRDYDGGKSKAEIISLLCYIRVITIKVGSMM